MCLAFRKSNPLQRLVADKDITIYKLVTRKNGSYVTLSQEAIVELNTPYQSVLDQPTEDGRFAFGRDTFMLGNKRNCMFVSVGLHAFTAEFFKSHEFVKFYKNLHTGAYVLKGFIPKGSEYYVNHETGMIVASAMMYKEFVDLNFLFGYAS